MSFSCCWRSGCRVKKTQPPKRSSLQVNRSLHIVSAVASQVADRIGTQKLGIDSPPAETPQVEKHTNSPSNTSCDDEGLARRLELKRLRALRIQNELDTEHPCCDFNGGSSQDMASKSSKTPVSQHGSGPRGPRDAIEFFIDGLEELVTADALDPTASIWQRSHSFPGCLLTAGIETKAAATLERTSLSLQTLLASDIIMPKRPANAHILPRNIEPVDSTPPLSTASFVDRGQQAVRLCSLSAMRTESLVLSLSEPSIRLSDSILPSACRTMDTNAERLSVNSDIVKTANIPTLASSSAAVGQASLLPVTSLIGQNAPTVSANKIINHPTSSSEYPSGELQTSTSPTVSQRNGNTLNLADLSSLDLSPFSGMDPSVLSITMKLSLSVHDSISASDIGQSYKSRSSYNTAVEGDEVFVAQDVSPPTTVGHVPVTLSIYSNVDGSSALPYIESVRSLRPDESQNQGHSLEPFTEKTSMRATLINFMQDMGLFKKNSNILTSNANVGGLVSAKHLSEINIDEARLGDASLSEDDTVKKAVPKRYSTKQLFLDGDSPSLFSNTNNSRRVISLSSMAQRGRKEKRVASLTATSSR